MMKTVLVTGANRGLGFATARRLGAPDTTVIVGARDAESGERAAAAIRADGNDAVAVTLDVRSPESLAAAAAAIRRRYGRLDLLVNNAGVLPEATADPNGPVSLDLFRATFDTNVLGAVAAIEAFLPLLTEEPRGRIVNISSTMGSLSDQSDPESPYYSVVVPAYQSSKAALNGVTVALAKALKDAGVAVYSVCPGFVQTDLTPMNRDNAPLTADDAAETVVRVALSADASLSGRFLSSDGLVPW
jgi:NAD(P)-dependent dehydrogenase (short-subunit alcohol dehydrogenase family)